MNRFVDNNKLPHLLLYGPPGTGKTSSILALAKRIFGPKYKVCSPACMHCMRTILHGPPARAQITALLSVPSNLVGTLRGRVLPSHPGTVPVPFLRLMSCCHITDPLTTLNIHKNSSAEHDARAERFGRPRHRRCQAADQGFCWHSHHFRVRRGSFSAALVPPTERLLLHARAAGL